jgi:hypothetical protein
MVFREYNIREGAPQMDPGSLPMLPPEGKPITYYGGGKLGEQRVTPLEVVGMLVIGVLGIMFTTTMVVLPAIIYHALFKSVYDRPVYLILAVVVGLAILGVVVSILRDLRKSRTVAFAQVVVAVIAGTIATFGAPTVMLQTLAVLTAAVVIANGVSKLWVRSIQ